MKFFAAIFLVCIVLCSFALTEAEVVALEKRVYQLTNNQHKTLHVNDRTKLIRDKERERREQWHKDIMAARTRRLKSNESIKIPANPKPLQANVALVNIGVEDTVEEPVSGSTDREREYNEGIRNLSRHLSEASKREKSYSVTGGNYDPAKFAEAKRERKLWMKGFIGLEDIKREARDAGEEWAQH